MFLPWLPQIFFRKINRETSGYSLRSSIGTPVLIPLGNQSSSSRSFFVFFFFKKIFGNFFISLLFIREILRKNPQKLLQGFLMEFLSEFFKEFHLGNSTGISLGKFQGVAPGISQEVSLKIPPDYSLEILSRAYSRISSRVLGVPSRIPVEVSSRSLPGDPTGSPAVVQSETHPGVPLDTFKALKWEFHQKFLREFFKNVIEKLFESSRKISFWLHSLSTQQYFFFTWNLLNNVNPR